MRHIGWLVILAFVGCRGCKSCQPSLPNDSHPPHDSADSSTDSTNRETADTAPPPPFCQVNETEPDNSPSTAVPFGIEQLGCGTFGDPPDPDFWHFTLPSDAWIEIRVDARQKGSLADPQLVLTGDDNTVAQMQNYDNGNQDVWMQFPATAQGYTLLLSEQEGAGDSTTNDYFYQLLVAYTKVPVTWTTTETTAADDVADQAQPIGDADRVFGYSDEQDDQDWYLLHLPAGKQTLTLQVDAYAYGSAGDFALALYQSDQTLIARAFNGPQGWQHDPYMQYESTGDEDVYVRVTEQFGRFGRPYWYVLGVTVEGG